MGEYDEPPRAGESAWERANVREGGHRPGRRIHVLVIGDDSRGFARSLAADLAESFPNVCLDRIDGAEDLRHYDATLAPDDHVVLGVITSEVADIDAALELMDAFPILEPTRWLVVTDETTHSDLWKSTTSGRLSSVLTVPWRVPLLAGQAYSAMVRHMLADGRTREQIVEILGEAPDIAVRGPLLKGLDLPEGEVVRRLLEGVEKVLGRRPRLIVPVGTDLAVQGQPVGAVHLVLDGRVSLHRDSMRGEVLAHHATSGPLIGLVSLARGENAFFTAVTTTPTRVVRLTHEQLEIALLEEPSLATPLAALAIQSLTRRLMRAEDLHLENAMLAADLEAQREALEIALEDLRRTRAELVEKARFAMLGELSAGIAHELNNPVTALARSAEHLGEDVERVLASSKGLEAARLSMRASLEAPPRSTAQERELAKEFLPLVDGDRRLARRLVLAGVSDPRQARVLKEASAGDLEVVESGARIGSSLRSVLAAAERVVDLTRSLKGYARPEAADLQPVDVAEGIDDVLRLTAYRMRGIEVIRDITESPRVLGHASKLQQVWTNLLVNAAEALEDEREDVDARREAGQDCAPARGGAPATITVAVREEGACVRVEISDNGPGVPPEIVEKIFEPHFTTKAGRVRFGLGMGMSIVRSIVADHHGTMRIESEPGRTVMSVSLPALPESSNRPEETP
ncbi:MAG: ATP-binding protein [Schaalia hyovaginalis]|uniref:sensor histidine kinase n=1 Tax=Schaalia hyovaginalis TaxID=29316 RepID=UPI002A82EBB7|nr:ATP-binding protein [Schaalia hyovaginalis]MDY3665257.1 ATP-binding protein [Schaalia hyovaginalis]MDY4261852.1 ATP-binding protein [Schaalia hyovaginalis]